jgi:hypothetical protein
VTRIITRILATVMVALAAVSLQAQTVRFVEVDGDPSVDAWKIILPNGTLSKDGSVGIIDLSSLGGGDMSTGTYDVTADGIIDVAALPTTIIYTGDDASLASLAITSASDGTVLAVRRLSAAQTSNPFEIQTEENDFLAGVNAAGQWLGDGSALTIDASGFDGNLATTDDTLQEVAQKLDDLVASGTDDQTAAEVAVTPTGNLAANDVQEALGELQGDIDSLSAGAVADDSITAAKMADGDHGDFTYATNVATLDTDSVSANELNAAGVEAELEAVLDLQDMQGAVTDAQVPNNITVDAATLASTVTVVDSTDATSSVLIADSATGSLAVKTDAGLTYNASTGMLTATGFTGPLTGTASVAATGDSATAFFSTGTVEHERGGLEADVSAYTGLIGINAGATVEVDTVAELTTAMGFTGTPSSSTFLRGDGSWQTPGGSGDVVGPSSATDNAIVTFDGTTGKLVKNSPVTIDASGNMSGIGTIDVDVITADEMTIPARAAGTTLSGWGEIWLPSPGHVRGTAVTLNSAAQAPNDGCAIFADDVEANNWVEWSRLSVPQDYDATADPIATLHIVLGDTDTADQSYKITMVPIAPSAQSASTLANEITLAYTPDASGASGDVQVASATLTGWGAALSGTGGQRWRIRVTRDGDDATNDASTADSVLVGLSIRYPYVQ